MNRIRTWWRSLSIQLKAAVLMGVPAVLGALITGGATIYAALLSKPKAGTTTTLGDPNLSGKPLRYVLRLMDSTGEPIVRAKVSLYRDRDVPQTDLADSDGDVHFDLPGDTQGVRLVVDAPGFLHWEKDVNPHRTGAEPVTLTALPKPRRSLPSMKRLSSAKSDVPKQASSGTSSPTPSAAPSSVCGPGVINCNVAPNEGHQDTYFNSPRPAPPISFTQSPILPIDRSEATNRNSPEFWALSTEGSLGMHPGVDLTIRVADDFQSPSFRVLCDRPCGIKEAFVETYAPGVVRSENIRYRVGTVPGDPEGLYLAFQIPTGTLDPGQGIRCRLRSSDTNGVTVSSVASFIRR